MTRFICILAVAIVVLGTSPQLVAQQADDSGARQLFQLLNQARAQQGLKTLEWNDQLAAAALKHSQLMAQSRKLSHDFPGEAKLMQRLANAGLRLDRSGENVAYDATVQGAHEGLMHSPPHRANILSPDYNAVGMAIISAGAMLYVTQDFAHLLPQTSDGDAAALIDAKFAELRKKSGAPRLAHEPNARVQSQACSMAQNDELVTRPALSLPGARYAVAFTATDPNQLPNTVARYRDVRDVDRYSLGVCFARSPSYPAGVYWVLLVLFSPRRS